MADSATSSNTQAAAAPAQAGSPKKPAKSAAGSKKPRAKPAHPRTADMVISAVKNLKERGGSSFQAIKKYITANYKVDAEKLAPYIKKALKTAVAGNSLVQTKGKGASGSFKLPSSEKPASGVPSKKKTTKKAPKAAKPAAKRLSKKPAAAKKAPKAATKKAAAKPATPAKAPTKKTTPKKATKPAKGSPTKKPKAPKPKKAPAKGKGKAAPKKK